MLYFPMDFEELTIDGLIHAGALSSAKPEADLRKIRLLAQQSIAKKSSCVHFPNHGRKRSSRDSEEHRQTQIRDWGYRVP